MNMKKMKLALFAALSLFVLNGVSAFAHGGETQSVSNDTTMKVATPKSAEVSSALSVKVNGVNVRSSANHLSEEGKLYASVEAFAQLFGLQPVVSDDHKSVKLGDKTISNVRKVQGELTAWVRDLADSVGAQQVSWDSTTQEAYILALPAGTIQISPEVVPAMGEHWSNPQVGDLPMGPIYGVYKGKLVFLEYMIAQDDFVKGKDHTNLSGMKGVPMPSVVQSDFEFQPKGHPGFEVAHYDFHFYFITDEEQHQIH